jgi:uncharacterized protein DUF6879
MPVANQVGSKELIRSGQVRSARLLWPIDTHQYPAHDRGASDARRHSFRGSQVAVTHRDIKPGSPDWAALFSSITTSAFRLETRQAYDVPAERDSLRRFAAGHAEAPPDNMKDWCDRVRLASSSGRIFSRVHVVTEPPSTYIRYELAAYAASSRAGEHIRILPVRGREWPRHIPPADFWLFDDSVLLSLAYNPAGQLTSAYVADSGRPVARARRIRDEATRLSVPYLAYMASLSESG